MAVKTPKRKVDVNKFLKLRKAPKRELVLRKDVEGRAMYRLILSEETVDGQRRIECTYADGTRIHGKNSHMKHPVIIVSALDQDEILWVAKFPFEIRLKNGNPFFRTFPAEALKGRDNLYRVASGPAIFTGKGRERHEFGAFKLTKKGVRDADCDYLDPHFIIDP